VSILDLGSLKPIRKFDFKTPSPHALFLPGDSSVLIGCGGDPLEIRDVKSGCLIKNDLCYIDYCSSMIMKLARESQLVVIAPASGDLVICDLMKASPLLEVKPLQASITGVSVDPDCSLIVLQYASSFGSTPIVWYGGDSFYEFEGSSKAHCTALSPDG